MNDIVLFKGANLAKGDLARFKGALQTAQATAPQIGGIPILKLGKDSIWRYGQKDTEVQEGSLWAVNPLTLMKGYVAWGKGGTKPAGKLARNVLQGNLPTQDELPDVGADWTEYVEFELTCCNGEDKGTVVKYASNSMGGVEAFHRDIITHLIHQAEVDSTKLVPVVELMVDGYYNNNAQYGVKKDGKAGWIAKPVFEIVEWMTFAGPEHGEADQADNDPPPAKQPEQQAAPTRRAAVGGGQPAAPAQPARRAPVSGNGKEAEPAAEPQQTVAAGQPEAAAEPVVRRRRRAV